jgi:hypothetical protein
MGDDPDELVRLQKLREEKRRELEWAKALEEAGGDRILAAALRMKRQAEALQPNPLKAKADRERLERELAEKAHTESQIASRQAKKQERVPAFKVLESDYSLVEYKGKLIPLGRMARQVVKVLHEQQGKPMHESSIRRAIGSDAGDEPLSQLFKRDPAKLLWGTLIKHATGQPGRYYLDLN